jgi:hypothetical protein
VAAKGADVDFYDPDFFNDRSDGSSSSAQAVVPLVLASVEVNSVVDVGSGIGTWTKQFTVHGVRRVLGIDGPHVDRSLLVIPAESFHAHDLNQPLRIDETFDLAVCLEVAEHLPGMRAAGLIEDLIRLAPCILFSAAIPGQGGTNHVNEQPLSYWVRLFLERGYSVVDCLRPAIWENAKVEWWYRQNIVFFARQGHPLLTSPAQLALDIVHPELLRIRSEEIEDLYRAQTVGSLGRALPRALGRSVRERLHRLKR